MKSLRLLFCFFCFCYALYCYLEKQNEATHLKMQLPLMVKKIQQIQEESKQLQYELEKMESPTYLLEVASHPQYAHLNYPALQDIVPIREGIALCIPEEKQQQLIPRNSTIIPVAIGTK